MLNRGIGFGLLVVVCAGSASEARAETVRFRAGLEVTRAFTGIPIGTTGTATVEYDTSLPDQLTSGTAHEKRGLYGHPDSPPVKILW